MSPYSHEVNTACNARTFTRPSAWKAINIFTYTYRIRINVQPHPVLRSLKWQPKEFRYFRSQRRSPLSCFFISVQPPLLCTLSIQDLLTHPCLCNCLFTLMAWKDSCNESLQGTNDLLKQVRCSEVNTYRIDRRVWIDLQHVNIICRVLEESIIWIQHFMAQ